MLTRLWRTDRLQRHAVGRTRVYLSPDAGVARRQRQALVQRTAESLGLPAEVAVFALVEFIRSPSRTPDQLAELLKRTRKVRVSPGQIVGLFEEHETVRYCPDCGRTFRSEGLCKAVATVFAGVLDFICHFHFLRDLGKDFLEPAYGRLRKRLRKHAVSTRLHQLVRELTQRLETGTDADSAWLEAIRTGNRPEDVERLPAACAYALAQRVLQGKKAGEGYGFPFDRPLLVFAERRLELHRRLPAIMNVYLRDQWQDNKPLYKFRHLDLGMIFPGTDLRLAFTPLRLAPDAQASVPLSFPPDQEV